MKMFDRQRGSRSLNSESDLDLYYAAARGNDEAMAALYRRHGALIYRFSLRTCQDASMAEEVTQDVFLALVRRPERFDPERSAISTWLCGIARRLIWKQLEQRQRYSTMDLSDEEDALQSLEDDPDVALTRKESIAAVQRGMDELPVALREVIVLCEFEEMKYEDAALVLEVPVGTVRSRLHRAKARLAKVLLGATQGAKEEKIR